MGGSLRPCSVHLWYLTASIPPPVFSLFSLSRATCERRQKKSHLMPCLSLRDLQMRQHGLGGVVPGGVMMSGGAGSMPPSLQQMPAGAMPQMPGGSHTMPPCRQPMHPSVMMMQGMQGMSRIPPGASPFAYFGQGGMTFPPTSTMQPGSSSSSAPTAIGAVPKGSSNTGFSFSPADPSSTEKESTITSTAVPTATKPKQTTAEDLGDILKTRPAASTTSTARNDAALTMLAGKMPRRLSEGGSTTEQLPHKCHKCDRSFSEVIALEQHLMLHQVLETHA